MARLLIDQRTTTRTALFRSINALVFLCKKKYFRYMIEVYMIRIWKTTLWWYGKCNPLRSRILKWDLYVITNLEMLFFRLITDIEMDFITIIDMGFVFYRQYWNGICILSSILLWDLYFIIKIIMGFVFYHQYYYGICIFIISGTCMRYRSRRTYPQER